MSARCPHRKHIVLSEQFVGCAIHRMKVLKIGTNATHNPENELKEDRRLQSACRVEVVSVVKMANVIALVLELNAALVCELSYYLINHLEGIGEDVIDSVSQIRLFPIIFELVVAISETKNTEVD